MSWIQFTGVRTIFNQNCQYNIGSCITKNIVYILLYCLFAYTEIKMHTFQRKMVFRFTLCFKLQFSLRHLLSVKRFRPNYWNETLNIKCSLKLCFRKRVVEFWLCPNVKIVPVVLNFISLWNIFIHSRLFLYEIKLLQIVVPVNWICLS